MYRFLLAADAQPLDEEIAASVGVSGSTVSRTKGRFVESNMEQAMSEESRPGATLAKPSRRAPQVNRPRNTTIAAWLLHITCVTS